MSDDAFIRAYRDRPEHHGTLGILMPELSALLKQHVNNNRTPPVCAIAEHAPPGPEATGRIHLNGTPACVDHGGIYPLDLVDPRKWSVKP